MTTQQNDPTKIKYYDDVDEDAHKRSAENRSDVDPAQRALWQSNQVSTDGGGPSIEDVSSIFNDSAQRAAENPITADNIKEVEAAEDTSAPVNESSEPVETPSSQNPTSPDGAGASYPAPEAVEDSKAPETEDATPAKGTRKTSSQSPANAKNDAAAVKDDSK